MTPLIGRCRAGGFDSADEALQFKLKEDRELAALAVAEDVPQYQVESVEEAVHHDL